jgi:DNA-directed RNA polymerase specialized sigma24 family protein
LSGNGFDSFFRQRFARTVVLLIAMGASRADAEDAVQEAMILAWRQWDTLQEPAVWVRTVAVRAHWKLARARQSMVLLGESAPGAAVDPDLGIFTEEQQYVLRLLGSSRRSSAPSPPCSMTDWRARRSRNWQANRRPPSAPTCGMPAAH